MDMGAIPGLGGSLGEGNGNPLQYSCLGNPMDKEAWQAIVYGVTKESDMSKQLTHTNMYNSHLSESSSYLHDTFQGLPRTALVVYRTSTKDVRFQVKKVVNTLVPLPLVSILGNVTII